MDTIIREIRPEEYTFLREFLYQAIYLPKGVEPPPRSVVDQPELQVYIEGFGTRPGDHCLVAEVGGKVVGAAWCRIMEDYGHIDNDTPSLAISLLPEYRGKGIGTRLLNDLLLLLHRLGSIPKHQIFRTLFCRDSEARSLVEAQGRVFLLDGEGCPPVSILLEQEQKIVQQPCPDAFSAILRQQ